MFRFNYNNNENVPSIRGSSEFCIGESRIVFLYQEWNYKEDKTTISDAVPIECFA
jgi:hypothetical protein